MREPRGPAQIKSNLGGSMNNDKVKPPEPAEEKPAAGQDQQGKKADESDRDERKPEDLSEEELRLMADTMPGEGPGDD
jgi:hypothetical protein